RGLNLGLAFIVHAGRTLVGRKDADVAYDGLGDFEGGPIAATFDRRGQDDIDMVTREDEAGDSGCRVHRDGDCSHARAESRGQEATVLRSDERTAGNRLAGRQRIANDSA